MSGLLLALLFGHGVTRKEQHMEGFTRPNQQVQHVMQYIKSYSLADKATHAINVPQRFSEVVVMNGWVGFQSILRAVQLILRSFGSFRGFQVCEKIGF
jgi:hypothetical protein